MSKRTVSILSIDAWGNSEDGFDWNSWHKVGEVNLAKLDTSEQGILSYMCSQGYTTSDNVSLVMVDDDQYNYVVCDRDSGQPLFAIAYGELM